MHTWGASPAAWRHWVSAGLTADLLPVVSNPGAAISPDSTMHSMGKTPSDYNFRRQCRGIPKWTQLSSTVQDVDRWARESDYGICLQTRTWHALDIDINNPRRVQRVLDHLDKLLPWHFFPKRTRSDSGRVVLLFSVADGFVMTKRTIPTEDGIIEFLGVGQQVVVAGTHPSGQRYEWPEGLPSAVPVLDVSEFDTLWESFCTAFLAPGKEATIARERRSIEDMDLSGLVLDPVADWLIANWEVHDHDHDGRLYIRCPFEPEHTTDTGYTATAYYPAGTGGYEQGHFVCLHAHCAARDDLEFLRETGYAVSRFPDLTADLDAADSGGNEASVPALGGDDDANGTPGSAVAEARPWPRFTRKGDKIEATQRNLLLGLEREDFAGRTIAWDNFLGCIMWWSERDQAGEPIWRRLADEDYVDIRVKLEERGFQAFGKDMLRDTIRRVAKAHKKDIAIEWLSRLQWDGVPRIERFFPDYLGTEDDAYSRSLGLYAWTAHAGRIMSPGIQADMAIILQGVQGGRKTSAIKAIAPDPDMYLTIRLNEIDDNLSRQLRGRVIGELEELRGLNSKGADEIKAWVSKTREEWIVKYSEHSEPFWRRLVFWGSTNDDEILNDPTGERRWLPAAVGKRLLLSAGGEALLRTRADGKVIWLCDVDRIIADRDQLWAEGAERFARDGILFGTAEELAVLEHGKFAVHDAWADPVFRWLNAEGADGVKPIDDPKGVEVSEVLTQAVGISLSQINRGLQMRLSKVLTALGLVRVNMYKVGWRYVRGA